MLPRDWSSPRLTPPFVQNPLDLQPLIGALQEQAIAIQQYGMRLQSLKEALETRRGRDGAVMGLEPYLATWESLRYTQNKG